MGKIEVLRASGKDLRVSKDQVLKLLNSEKRKDPGEDFTAVYDTALPEILELMEPAAALTLAPFPENGVFSEAGISGNGLFVMMTAGQKVNSHIENCFKNGEYLKGLISDAIVSLALFSFEKDVLKRVREMAASHNAGIRRRLEAPDELPIEAQDHVFNVLNAASLLNMSITPGHMLSPVKSYSFVFETTDDNSMMHLTHDCKNCMKKDCINRTENIILKVKDANGDHEFSVKKGSILKEILDEYGLPLNSPCGGKGLCGKCSVKVLKGNIGISSSDRKIFSEKELSQGFRLSCRAEINEDTCILIPTEAEKELFTTENEDASRKSFSVFSGADSGLAIAIDIGTTTLAFSLIDVKRKTVLYTFSSVNSQRMYGNDVISRIEAAGNDRHKELRQLIIKDLIAGIEKLTEGLNREAVKCIAISGNTTMLHLLRGYDTSTLGSYPFDPVNIKLEQLSLRDLFDTEKPSNITGNIPVYLLPGISVFVGADIVSGLSYLNFERSEKLCALIDLGTNGEIAVGNKDRILVTSSAAGPAFEGGNIKWGCGSIKGAISGVEIMGDQVNIRTIAGSLPPAGICGTGVIETAAELYKHKIIDDTGLLRDEYFENGFPLSETETGEIIVFTQDDIRELQLAKSAVRAGLEVLLKNLGAGYEDIDTLYIAGSFGTFLDPAKAASIGLIPPELTAKCTPAGNTSLRGLERFLSDIPAGIDAASSIAEKAEEIVLANASGFNDMYLKYMNF